LVEWLEDQEQGHQYVTWRFKVRACLVKLSQKLVMLVIASSGNGSAASRTIQHHPDGRFLWAVTIG
jgi:hypothetical protein